MNKKALLITSIAAVFAVGVGTIAISGIEQIQKANEIKATGEYIKTNTKVDIEHISNVQGMTDWDDYYVFGGSGVSNKGATINVQEYDYATYGGSYIYSDDPNSLDYNDENYLLKMTFTSNNYGAPMLHINVLIHEKAELINEESYLLYDEVFDAKYEKDSIHNQKLFYTDYDVVEGESGDYYCSYYWEISFKDSRPGNSVNVKRVHLEYYC